MKYTQYPIQTVPEKKWAMPIRHWREALNHFTILWPERMPGSSRHESAESF